MARKTTQQLAYTALRIEGGLIPAEELTRLTGLAAPEATEQTEAHYDIPKGLKLRDEIARHFKIAQHLWQDFQQQRTRQDARAHQVTESGWLMPLCRHVLGMGDLTGVSPVAATSGQQTYNIGHAALGGRLPVIMAGHDQPLDQAAERFSDTNPETGRTRKRSPYMLAQEALNASDNALWAMVTNGLKLRILRDNPSLTRPAYVEVDLEAIFTEELYADFTAFWLLAHASRFGKLAIAGQATEPTDCPWERWRNAGQKSGETVRMNLRFQVEKALRSLGTAALMASASSPNVRPLIPSGATRSGVPFRVRPMNPTATALRPVPNRRMPVAGNSVERSGRKVLAERYVNLAPANGSIWQNLRAVCWAQPPFCLRSSSSVPWSNSWLPTALKSTPMRFITPIAGSSRNSDEATCDALIMSPAETVAE